MIRPFTCVCFLLACGSGLYLYQAKHRVQVLDREIERTVRATEELRERIRILHAEFTLQNDPQRLQGLADQFLTLKTVMPGQFTNMAELGSRLPVVRPPEPPRADPPVVIAQTPGAEEPRPVPVAVAAPPPSPPAAPVAAPHPPAPPPSKPVVAVVAAASPPPPRVEPPRPPALRPVIAEAPPPPRAAPVVARPVAATIEPPRSVTPAAASGSALGMARGNSSLPPPTPMRFYENGGGG